MNEPIRVLIADDHEIIRDGLRLVLAEEPPDIEVAGQASDGLEAVTLAVKLRPDVILMDLVMPHLGGVEAIRRIRAAGVDSRVLVLTTFAEEDQVREAILAGAIGYLLKDVLRAELVSAIRSAAHGRPTLHPEAQHHLMRQVAAVAAPAPAPFGSLTEREMDVLRLIARGSSNKKIAATLSISVGTVKGYVSGILAKLGLADRTQAALFAVRHGIETPESSSPVF